MPKIIRSYQKVGIYYLPLINPEDRYIVDPSVVTISNSERRMWVDYDIDCVCIEFDYWGETKTLQVPFAKYRYENWFKCGTDGLTISEIGIDPKRFYIGESSIPITSDMPIITDADLQSRLFEHQSDKTGKENTDIWMQYTNYVDSNGITGVPTIEACRSLVTDKITEPGYFDCPNVYELAIAWIESDNIDLLDPTAESYPDRKLGKTNPEGRFDNSVIITSACDNTAMGAYTVYSIIKDGTNGNISKQNRVPILPCKVI